MPLPGGYLEQMESKHDMNTISIPTRNPGTARFARTPAPVGRSRGPISPSLRPLPTWLPAPLPCPRSLTRPPQPHQTARIRHLRLPTAIEPNLEKWLIGLLLIAAVTGIGYGFSCLLDLVRHWAAFNSGIERLIL